MKRLYLVLLCLMILIVSLLALVPALHPGGSTLADMPALSAVTGTGQLPTISQVRENKQNYDYMFVGIRAIYLLTLTLIVIVSRPYFRISPWKILHAQFKALFNGALASGSQLKFPI